MKFGYIAIFLAFVLCSSYGSSEATNSEIMYAQLLSCGCKINNNQELKAFVDNEAQNFPLLEVKLIGGNARIKFFDINRNEVGETVEIGIMKTQEIVDLLTSKGLSYITKEKDTIIDDVGTIVA